jgi:hypothetical protein
LRAPFGATMIGARGITREKSQEGNHNSGIDNSGIGDRDDDGGDDAVPDIILIYPAAMAFLGS